MIKKGLLLVWLIMGTVVSIAQPCTGTIATYPYAQGFETNDGGWIPGGTSSDWEWGIPTKPIITTAGTGTRCWVTGTLTGGAYNNSENSFLVSPCFNFSTLQYPEIRFKLFWETERRFDGASFEYSIDGGNSWTDVTESISGPVPVGICGIQAVNDSVVYAAGRVGGPPILIKSTNAGETWQGSDLSDHCQMILDVWFVSADTGFVFAGTSLNVAAAAARILRTTDGGNSWEPVYTSSRNSEIMWKAWFPSRQIGYASIQSTQRYIAKTINGGESWTELPLVNTGIREFGIGFINDSVGWVGGENTGYQTLNGGQTWTNKNIGQYANKFSIVKNPDGSNTAYAIGLRIFKMSTSAPTSISVPAKAEAAQLVYPNPAATGSYISFSLEKLPGKIVKAELISADGKSKSDLFSGFYPGTRESPFLFPLPVVAAGKDLVRFTDEKGKQHQQELIINR